MKPLGIVSKEEIKTVAHADSAGVDSNSRIEQQIPAPDGRGDDPAGPLFAVLREAIRAVPSVRFAMGLLGVFAVIAIVVKVLGLNYRLAVIGAIVMFLLMVTLVVFSKVAKLPSSDVRGAARFFVFATTAVIFIMVGLLISSLFFGHPLDLRHWITGAGAQVSTLIQRATPVEDLVHGIDHVRGDFQAATSNELLRLKVNQDAAKLATEAVSINDGTLDLANRIAKYEYGAYAYVMAASTETNPTRRMQFVRATLNLCDQARVVLKQLQARTASTDNEANRARTWAIEDQPTDRVAFLAAMAWCLDYRTTHSITSRKHARDEWAKVAGSFRDQYGDSTPELVNCAITSKKGEEH